MISVSCKLPEPLADELRALAERQGVSRSAVIREALASYLARAATPAPGSFADRARDLAGCIEGPPDLSFIPANMDPYGS